MKQPIKFFALRWYLLLAFLSLFNLMVLAQENNEGSGGGTSSTTTTTKKTDIKITTDNASDTWYTSPWVWVVGAAVFILLLVALLSNRGGRDSVSTSDRVTVKKSVERDRGTDV